MKTQLSYPQFYEPMMHAPQVGELLARCISEKAALHLSLEPDKLEFSVASPSRPAVVGPILAGRWRSPLIRGEHQITGALLMAPLLFLIEDLWLPHTSLFTLGRKGKTVANFAMLNIFYAACRREQIVFDDTPAARRSSVAPRARELARVYANVVNAHLNDERLSGDNRLEKILASAHLPVVAYSNPLLEAGAVELRRVAALAYESPVQEAQEDVFKRTRERVLTAYRN